MDSFSRKESKGFEFGLCNLLRSMRGSVKLAKCLSNKFTPCIFLLLLLVELDTLTYQEFKCDGSA